MFEYVRAKDLFLQEKMKTQRIFEKLEKTKSDLDYIAMMADIDLDTEGENGQEV